MRLFLSSFFNLKQQDLFPPNLALKQFANINLRGCFPSLLSVDIESAVIENSCLSINLNGNFLESNKLVGRGWNMILNANKLASPFNWKLRVLCRLQCNNILT